MAVGRPLGEVSLDLVGRRQLQDVTTPRMHVAALGGRAADQRAAPVHPIAPESGRSRPVIGGHQTDGRRGSHVERDPGRIDAVRAHVAGCAVADGRKPRHAAQRRPATAPGRAQPAPPARVGEREEPIGLHTRRRQRLGVPAQRLLVEQAGARGHRHARRRLAEERELQMLADRSPEGDTRDVGRTLAGQPPELGRPVRAVQMTAGSLVQGRVVEGPAQERGIGRAARVGPGEDRRDRPPGGVEAEQPVPEGRDADGPDVVVAGGAGDRVEARRHGLEQHGRVVLDAAVVRERRARR